MFKVYFVLCKNDVEVVYMYRTPAAQYLCFMVGSYQWFLETLFRRVMYIVFPNLLLEYPDELKGFKDFPRRSLCIVYDDRLNKFVGIVHCFDTALGIKLEDFYKSCLYGTTVAVEWFWSKWGGDGIGVIDTKPRYVYSFEKPLDISYIEKIVSDATPTHRIDFKSLLEESMLSGIAFTKVDNIYSIAKKLWKTTGFKPWRVSPPHQAVVLAQMLKSIGISMGFNVETKISNSDVEVKWFVNGLKLFKIFKVYSYRRFLKLVEKGREPWEEVTIALHDVESGSLFAETIGQLFNIDMRSVEKIKKTVIGWGDILELYTNVNIVKNILINSIHMSNIRT